MTKKINKLEKIRVKIEQLQSRAASLEAHERAKQKKIDTRRKILAGAWILEQYADKMDVLKKELDKFLVRDNDRKLFDLTPKEKKK
jgi:hypothetical protein